MFFPPTESSGAKIVSKAVSLMATPPYIAASTAIMNDLLRHKERAGDDAGAPALADCEGWLKIISPLLLLGNFKLMLLFCFYINSPL